jgi:hypothetical protein
MLDVSLDLCPIWEKSLELKARAFLYLGKFKDVANVLQEYIPSLWFMEIVPSKSPLVSKYISREKEKLLSIYEENGRLRAIFLF